MKNYLVKIEPILIEVDEEERYALDVAHETFADMMRDGDLPHDIVYNTMYRIEEA